MFEGERLGHVVESPGRIQYVGLNEKAAVEAHLWDVAGRTPDLLEQRLAMRDHGALLRVLGPDSARGCQGGLVYGCRGDIAIGQLAHHAILVEIVIP
jgi:hypothetical protein